MTVAAILAGAQAQQRAEPADRLASAWALHFDILREHVAAAHLAHPLQMEDYAAAGSLDLSH